MWQYQVVDTREDLRANTRGFVHGNTQFTEHIDIADCISKHVNEGWELISVQAEDSRWFIVFRRQKPE